jgi:hypothetical protein
MPYAYSLYIFLGTILRFGCFDSGIMDLLATKCFVLGAAFASIVTGQRTPLAVTLAFLKTHNAFEAGLYFGWPDRVYLIDYPD